MMCLDCEHMTKDCLLGTRTVQKGARQGAARQQMAIVASLETHLKTIWHVNAK